MSIVQVMKREAFWRDDSKLYMMVVDLELRYRCPTSPIRPQSMDS
jgi:hypothetical protein